MIRELHPIPFDDNDFDSKQDRAESQDLLLDENFEPLDMVDVFAEMIFNNKLQVRPGEKE